MTAPSRDLLRLRISPMQELEAAVGTDDAFAVLVAPETVLGVYAREDDTVIGSLVGGDWKDETRYEMFVDAVRALALKADSLLESMPDEQLPETPAVVFGASESYQGFFKVNDEVRLGIELFESPGEILWEGSWPSFKEALQEIADQLEFAG